MSLVTRRHAASAKTARGGPSSPDGAGSEDVIDALQVMPGNVLAARAGYSVLFHYHQRHIAVSDTITITALLTGGFQSEGTRMLTSGETVNLRSN